MAITQIHETLIEPSTREIFMPTGTIIESACRIAPAGYLLCNGASYLRSQYSLLFNAICPLIGNIVVTNNSIINLLNHGFFTGESCYLITNSELPAPLQQNILYFIIVIDANNFRLATTYNNAIANTFITLTTIGIGTHSVFFCPFGFTTINDFKVPDLIGATTRMRGTSIGYNTNITAPMGFKQNDAFGSHNHGGGNHNHSYVDNYMTVWASPIQTGGTWGPVENGRTTGDSGTIISTQGENETRMKNVTINKFIKF